MARLEKRTYSPEMAAARDNRLVLKSACAKLKEGTPLTEHEAHVVGFMDAGFGPAEATRLIAEIAQEGGRNAMARVSALRAYIDIVGAQAPVQTETAVNIRVSLDDIHRLAGFGPDRHVETRPSHLLPDGAGVDPVDPTSGGAPSGGGESPGHGGNGRGRNGAQRG